jgi:hypothetical protein
MKTMRIWPVLAVAILLAMGCGREGTEGQTAESAAPQEAVAPVAAKVGEMFDEAVAAISGGEIGRGIGSLLDITLLTGPETEQPAGFAKEIEKARAGFSAGDMATGLDHVAAALKIWDPEKGEAAATPGPDSEAVPAPIAQFFKDKITTARDLMIRGEAKSGVTAILEGLLLLGPARAK